MKSSDTLSKLAPALAKAQAEFKSVGKSGHNTYDKYKYANLEDYITTVRDVLANHGLSVLSSSEEILPLEDRTTKNGGKEHAVRVRLTTRIVHESGEWIETESCGEGQDRADKAVYKAITGARKYALASALNLATTDDPEQDDDHEPPSRQQAERPAVKHAQAVAAEHGLMTAEQLERRKRDDKWVADVTESINKAADYPALLAISDLIQEQNGYVKGQLRAVYSARAKELKEPAMAGVG